MANQGCFQEYLLDPAYNYGHDPVVCFGDDVTMLDATMLDATDQASGSLMDMQGCVPYDRTTHLRPVRHINVNANASFEDVVAMLDAPAIQRTPRTNVTPTASAPPNGPPAELTYSGLDDVRMQKAPVLDSLSRTCDMSTSERPRNSFTRPTQTQYAAVGDWERNRALLTKLYREENKTLEEVKFIMKEQYGFNAT